MIASVRTMPQTPAVGTTSAPVAGGASSAAADVPQDLFTAATPTAGTVQATATASAKATAEQPGVAPNVTQGAGAAMGLNSPAVAAALDQLASLGSATQVQQPQ